MFLLSFDARTTVELPLFLDGIEKIVLCLRFFLNLMNPERLPTSPDVLCKRDLVAVPHSVGSDPGFI